MRCHGKIPEGEVNIQFIGFCRSISHYILFGYRISLALSEATNDGQAVAGNMNPLLFFSCTV